MLPVAPPYPVPLCVTLLAVAAASTDIATRRIPNRLVLLGGRRAGCPVPVARCRGRCARMARRRRDRLRHLLPFYLLRGMAAGDVKLMLAIGAWVGAEMTFYIVLATFLAGGIGAIAFALLRGRMRQMWANVRCSRGAQARAPAAGGPSKSHRSARCRTAWRSRPARWACCSCRAHSATHPQRGRNDHEHESHRTETRRTGGTPA